VKREMVFQDRLAIGSSNFHRNYFWRGLPDPARRRGRLLRLHRVRDRGAGSSRSSRVSGSDPAGWRTWRRLTMAGPDPDHRRGRLPRRAARAAAPRGIRRPSRAVDPQRGSREGRAALGLARPALGPRRDPGRQPRGAGAVRPDRSARPARDRPHGRGDPVQRRARDCRERQRRRGAEGDAARGALPRARVVPPRQQPLRLRTAVRADRRGALRRLGRVLEPLRVVEMGERGAPPRPARRVRRTPVAHRASPP
jgi:hypothetical protein